MKKITYIVALAALTTFISCKNDTKSSDSDNSNSTEMTTTDDSKNSTDSDTNKSIESKKANTNNDKRKRVYIVRPDSTTVHWTAYKTTDKVAVGGQFTNINFKTSKGATIAEAYEGLEFSIPISSLFTDNEVRDEKLIASFFDIMLDTKSITGKLSFDKEDMCTATIKMNGKSNDVSLSYFAAENEVIFTAELNLEDWDATGALEALNIACKDLHKGADGISKTWTEVAIQITTKY